MTNASPWLYWGMVACFGYLLATYGASAVLLIAALVEHAYQARRSRFMALYRST